MAEYGSFVGLGYHGGGIRTTIATGSARRSPAANVYGGGFVRQINPEILRRSPPPPRDPNTDSSLQEQQDSVPNALPPLRRRPPSQLNPESFRRVFASTPDPFSQQQWQQLSSDPAMQATGVGTIDNNDPAVEAARLRAIEVIAKFQNQAEGYGAGYLLDPSNLGELGLKRQIFLEKFEEKLRLAMVKNLEYVAKVEDERLQAKLALQQQAEQYHVQLEEYHSQLLINRQTQQSQQKQNQHRQIQNSQAGIGTSQQQRYDKKRKQQQQHNESAAIYVSNIPKDGSCSQELMQALFSSYGNLRKIHFYYDKHTGNLKGDALVIYNMDSDGGNNDKSDLIDTVCSQVRIILCR